MKYRKEVISKNIFINILLIIFISIITNFSCSRIAKVSTAKKNFYLRKAVHSSQIKTIGEIALQMNLYEYEFDIPYDWGGDIFDNQKGFDCTGFIHGIMYYLDEGDYKARFSTKALYHMFKLDPQYKCIFKAKNYSIEDINSLIFNTSDIFLWPPTNNKFGHIAVVSKVDEKKVYLTHFVNDKKLNNIDEIGSIGPGINTLSLDSLIKYKKKDFLFIYRKVEN